MPHSFGLHNTNVINDILRASSQQEINSLIETVIVMLEQKETNLQKRIAIAEKLRAQLCLLNPLNKDAQQWSNIKLTKILLYRYLKQHGNIAAPKE